VLNYKGLNISQERLVILCDNFLSMIPMDELFPPEDFPNSKPNKNPELIETPETRRASQYSLFVPPEQYSNVYYTRFNKIVKSRSSHELLNTLIQAAYWKILRKHVDGALPQNFPDAAERHLKLDEVSAEANRLYGKMDHYFSNWGKAGTRMRALYLLFVKTGMLLYTFS
jgi:hypothetical protein